MKPKPKASGSVRVRAYEVMSRAVDEGVAYGWNRAHKHDDHPDSDAIRNAVSDAVLQEIGEYFDFGAEP